MAKTTTCQGMAWACMWGRTRALLGHAVTRERGAIILMLMSASSDSRPLPSSAPQSLSSSSVRCRQEHLQDILTKVQEFAQAGPAKYTIQVVRNLTPAWSGYPARRKQVFLIGWRAGIDGARAGEPLQPLMDAPMRAHQSFLRFLGMKRERSIGLAWGVSHN